MEIAPKMSSIEADVVLYDSYETTYGIFNHIGAAQRRPMASVALHEHEENSTTSQLYYAIEAYSKKGIKDLFGLSLIEYLNLPSEYCLLLLELAAKHAVVQSGVVDNITKAMNIKPKK